MKYRIVATLVLIAGLAVAGGFRAPLTGTFSGGSGAYTNTGGSTALEAMIMYGTPVTCTVYVVNVAGFTNWVTHGTVTNHYEYKPNVADKLKKNGVITMESGTTNKCSYLLWLK